MATPEADVVPLAELAEDLLAQAADSSARRAAHTLIGGPAPLRQVVMALLAGSELAEHANPGTATLQVLRGRARLQAGSRSWDLPAGSFVQIPDARHSLVAGTDVVVVLTVVAQ